MNRIIDGLYTFNCNLDLKKIKSSGLDIHDAVSKYVINRKIEGFSSHATKSITTQAYNQYNFFNYSLPEVHTLYKTIQSNFDKVKLDFYENRKKLFKFGPSAPTDYFIEAWINVYQRGDCIDWHSHVPTIHNAWHGFFCVDTVPSKTTFRFANKSNQDIDVISEDNLLVITRSGPTNEHRTWPWEFDRPRITIAFDIVPGTQLLTLYGKGTLDSVMQQTPEFKNHWIPI